MIDRLFSVIILKLTQCRAHAADRFYFAPGTFRNTCYFLAAGLFDCVLPSFSKTSETQIPLVACTEPASLQIPIRVDRKAANAGTTVEQVIPMLRRVHRAFEPCRVGFPL